MYSANEIAKWFLIVDRCGDNKLEISNLKLQKLLYYAQGIYLAITNKPLFEENILAWKHGPVVKEVYSEYKKNADHVISYEPEENDISIIGKIENDENARDTLQFVVEEFGQYTAWKLRCMTHEESPWLNTERDNIIKNEIIKDYFVKEIVEVS